MEQITEIEEDGFAPLNETLSRGRPTPIRKLRLKSHPCG